MSTTTTVIVKPDGTKITITKTVVVEKPKTTIIKEVKPTPSPTLGTFNVVLEGAAGVGKTTFLQRHTDGVFLREYIHSIGTKVRPLQFYTNKGLIEFNIYDGHVENVKIDGAIIFFSLTDRTSFERVKDYYDSVIASVGKVIPTVLVGNKADVKERVAKVKEVGRIKERLGVPYWDISVKSNYNYGKPFLWLIRRFLVNPTVRFVEGPSITPPTVSIE